MASTWVSTMAIHGGGRGAVKTLQGVKGDCEIFWNNFV